MFERPTPDEWNAIQDTYPFEDLPEVDEFRCAVFPRGSVEAFKAGHYLQNWTVHLQNRLIQTRWSWVMTMFFFNKGIPDDEWYRSPGRGGAAIQYYPNFTSEDHTVK